MSVHELGLDLDVAFSASYRPETHAAMEAAFKISQEAMPCDTCPLYAQCSDYQLSCEAFDKYVAGRPWRNAWRWPLPEWFVGTLEEDRQLKSWARRHEKTAVVPTLYAAFVMLNAQGVGGASARA